MREREKKNKNKNTKYKKNFLWTQALIYLPTVYQLNLFNNNKTQAIPVFGYNNKTKDKQPDKNKIKPNRMKA